MVKQRRESADIYRKSGREDRAAVEEAEIAVIERFLPAQMSDAEAAGRRSARSSPKPAPRSMKDMGRVMALVKERLGGVDRTRAGQRTGEGGALLASAGKRPRRAMRRSRMIESSNAYLRPRCGLRRRPVIPVTPSITRSIKSDHDRDCERAGHAELQIGA